MKEVFRAQANLFESQRLIEQLQATWGEDCDLPAMLSMWSEMYNGDSGEPLQPGSRCAMQLCLARTGSTLLGSSILHQDLPGIKGALAGLDPGVYILSSGYVGFTNATGMANDDDNATPAECIEAYGDELITTMQDIARHPVRDAIRFEFYPSNLNDTFARSQIQGLIASAHTYAQRGDNEDVTEHARRLAFVRTLTDAGQICLKDLDEVALGLRRGERDDSVEWDVTLQAARKSELAAAFGDFGELRNRCLSWLHPDHDGFVAVTLPVPEPLQDPAALLAVYTTLLSPPPGDEFTVVTSLIERLAESTSESQTFELLMQTIPCNDESSAFVIVLPLRSGWAGSPIAAEVQQAGFTAPVSEIDGYPCHRLADSVFTTVTLEYALDVVETETCVAILVGTDAARSAFRSIVRRDFDECPKAARYLNSAIAADFSLSGEWPARFLDLTDLWADRKSDNPLKTRMTASVQVRGEEFTGQLRFENDAALLGALLMDLAGELLFDNAFEWLDD